MWGGREGKEEGKEEGSAPLFSPHQKDGFRLWKLYPGDLATRSGLGSSYDQTTIESESIRAGRCLRVQNSWGSPISSDIRITWDVSKNLDSHLVGLGSLHYELELFIINNRNCILSDLNRKVVYGKDMCSTWNQGKLSRQKTGNTKQEVEWHPERVIWSTWLLSISSTQGALWGHSLILYPILSSSLFPEPPCHQSSDFGLSMSLTVEQNYCLLPMILCRSLFQIISLLGKMDNHLPSGYGQVFCYTMVT